MCKLGRFAGMEYFNNFINRFVFGKILTSKHLATYQQALLKIMEIFPLKIGTHAQVD